VNELSVEGLGEVVNVSEDECVILLDRVEDIVVVSLIVCVNVGDPVWGSVNE
jgi:hypothetical protein